MNIYTYTWANPIYIAMWLTTYNFTHVELFLSSEDLSMNTLGMFIELEENGWLW